MKTSLKCPLCTAFLPRRVHGPRTHEPAIEQRERESEMRVELAMVPVVIARMRREERESGPHVLVRQVAGHVEHEAHDRESQQRKRTEGMQEERERHNAPEEKGLDRRKL